MKMSRHICAVLTLLVGLVDVDATEVVFEGASPRHWKKIERMAEQGGQATDSIKAFLVGQGYLDADVVEKDGRLAVSAGKLYSIDTVVFRGDSSFHVLSDRPFSKANVEWLIETALGEHYELGNYYSSVKVERLSKHDDGVTVEVILSRGPRVTVGKKLFTGLKRTDPRTVERYIPIKQGDILNRGNVAGAETGAGSIPFVSFRPPVTIRARAGYTLADLEFHFSEKKQILFEGAGGYDPGSSSGVVWNLNVGFQNLFGKGKRISLLSERRGKGRNILDLEYSQPVFAIGRGKMNLSVATRNYRDRFYEFMLRGEYSAVVRNNLEAGVSFGWRSVEPAAGTASYSAYTSSFMIKRKNVHNEANPSSGLDIDWTIAFSYRRYGDDNPGMQPEKKSFSETRNLVSIGWYQSLAGRLAVHLGLSYRGLETNESLPPVSELFFIGGPGTIRGFRNEQFTALRAAFGTIEPRLRFSSGYVFTFYDGAYISNRIGNVHSGVRTDEFYRCGYGFGMAIVDPGRSVKISLGWNKELRFDEPRLSVQFSSGI